MKVLKFGGTSLENAKKIKNVANFIAETHKNEKLVVVVSAMGKTTNKLEVLGTSISDSPDRTAMARLLTSGEIISASLLSLTLEDLKIKTKIMTAKDANILTHGDPLNSLITSVNKSKIEKELEDHVVIITGFQGIDSQNNLTCLGRGGSDTTALMLASVFSCKAYIYTDVDGYYISDPKLAKTKKLDSINIKSAIENAYVGGKVLDRRCLEIASKNKTDVEVLKSQTLSGSTISYQELEGFSVDAISYKTNLSYVKIITKNIDILQLKIQNEYLDTLFENISFQDDNYKVSFVCPSKDLKTFIKNGEVYSVNEVEEIVLTGSGLISDKSFIKKVQKVLRENKIDVRFLTLHPTFLKILVDESQAEKATKCLLFELNI